MEPIQIAVIAGPLQREAWLQAVVGAPANCLFYNSVHEAAPGAGAVFDLEFSPDPERITALTAFLPAPVFINSVCHTLAGIRQPFIRINAWPGFLNRTLQEIAVPDAATAQSGLAVLNMLGLNCKTTPDVPGFITPRVIAMIVNEAYYALGEGVSTRDEIDVAMKLGTGYPRGPFEWAAEIGLNRIYKLLRALEQTGPRYTIAPALAQAAGPI